MDHDASEEWRSDGVGRRSGALRIKAHGTEHVPGGHLAGIIVARQAIGPCVELRKHDLTYSLLCFPQSTGVVVEICDAMARLISLIVEAFCEESVQLCNEISGATTRLDKPGDIVRYEEGIL